MRSVGYILSLLDFDECAPVIGHGDWSNLKEFIEFGSLKESLTSGEAKQMYRAALQAVVRMGVPRTLAVEWKLGW